MGNLGVIMWFLGDLGEVMLFLEVIGLIYNFIKSKGTCVISIRFMVGGPSRIIGLGMSFGFGY